MRFIHETYWRFFKGNVLQKQRTVRRLPLEKIKIIQWTRLKNLLDYVYIHNNFYRTLFTSLKLTPDDIRFPEDFLQLPIFEKKDYRNNFDKIISSNRNQKNYTLSSTSGSSGEPFRFYIDDRIEGHNMAAAFLLNQESMGINPFKKRNELEIKGVPRNEIKDFKWKSTKHRQNSFRKQFNSKIIGLSANKIKREYLNNIIELFNSEHINAIIGYSTSILTLAGLLLEQDISIKLEYIMTIGEGLLPRQRQIISKAFQCPVYRNYIASECIHMGCECYMQNGYHLDIYNYYFEFLKDDRPAKNGEVGEIVVTNLNNHIFPFIRYKIGDSALLTNESCKCNNNFPIVKDIYGRTTDIVRTPSGKELSDCFIGVPFGYLDDYIRQFQIIQVEQDKLLVRIVPDSLFNTNILEEFRNIFTDFLERSMVIDIELADSIDCGKSGKRKVLVTLDQYRRDQAESAYLSTGCSDTDPSAEKPAAQRTFDRGVDNSHF